MGVCAPNTPKARKIAKARESVVRKHPNVFYCDPITTTTAFLPFAFHLLDLFCLPVILHTTMMKLLVLAVLTAVSSAWVSPQSTLARPSTKLYENFGLSFAEDSYANQPAEIGGEGEYKQWVNTVSENNLLTRKVNKIPLRNSTVFL